MAIGIALLVFICTFVGSLLGMWQRSILPQHHLGADSKDLVRLCMGLIATMTALILGLVTASAKSAFDAQDAALKAGAASILTLDRTLAAYGPETKAVREELRAAVESAVDSLWHAAGAGAPQDREAARTRVVEQIERGILALSPRDDAQRWLQSQALASASEVLKTRWAAFAGAGAVVPGVFIGVIVFWLTLLFWSFGLFAPRNALVTGVLLLSALSVAASVFLILEMQRPLDGLMTISDAPLRYALAHLGQ